MSELPPPDDLSQWPEDPNELLGVSFGIAPRELRRAYHRLIRIYKPEQFPEQFRRIREAYENLLRIAEWYAPHVEASDSPAAEESQILPDAKDKAPDAEAAPWIAGHPQPAEEAVPEVSTPTPTRRPDEMNELWQAAIAGRPAPAYERLMQLTPQNAGRVELYQRLYWLLTLWPDLDSQRVPADWLVQGLLATDLAGPLRELYRQEVNNDSTEAFGERYEKLLESPVPAGPLADLMEWRFEAAARLGRWNVVSMDLLNLRSRFGLGEEVLWLRLLLSTARMAAWAADEEGEFVLTACRVEMEDLEHLSNRMSYSFDRLDLVEEASEDWRELSRKRGVFESVYRLLRTPIDRSEFQSLRNPIPAIILKCIGDLCSRPCADVRESLTVVLEAIASSPHKWLKHLDAMHKRAPATLALFGELLDRFEQSRDGESAEPGRDFPTELCLAFLSRLNAANYEKARGRLLTFCLREQIAPEEMAEVASAWEQALRVDWPLRYVCRACRLFWDRSNSSQ